MATSRQAVRTALVLAAMMLASAGCKSDPPPASGPDTQSEKAPPAAAEASSPAPEKTAAQGEEPEGTVPSAAIKEPGAPPDKDQLHKAYLEIYCAQRREQTEKLLEIYTRYGFEDPKTWTKVWTEAAKDSAWVAEITQEATRTCP